MIIHVWSWEIQGTEFQNLVPTCRCIEYETLKQASNSTQKSWAWRKRINPLITNLSVPITILTSNIIHNLIHLRVYFTFLTALVQELIRYFHHCRLIKRLDFPGPNFSLYFLGYEVCDNCRGLSWSMNLFATFFYWFLCAYLSCTTRKREPDFWA